MGKPYAAELELLEGTYGWAMESDVSEIVRFAKDGAGAPLYAVGSGGSFSAAALAALLHQRTGRMAKCLTPLEFLGQESVDRDCSALMVTAGGDNPDILAAFDRAVDLGIENIGAVCASTGNRLTGRAAGAPGATIHAARPPTGRDGFLATNTLVATLTWMCRAYVEAHSMPYHIPDWDLLVDNEGAGRGPGADAEGGIGSLSGKDTVICLHGYWGSVAAIDFESKMSEAGLANVQRADYRSFAHGRHNWLDKNRGRTGVLALVEPGCERVAGSTLELVPSHTPKAAIRTEHEGPPASMSLTAQILHAVRIFGESRGIDPGRPGVADFGRKMYHLRIPRTADQGLTDAEKLALRIKFGRCDAGSPAARKRTKDLRGFLGRMAEAKFGAIVFDYDGTLCDAQCRSGLPSEDTAVLLNRLLRSGIAVGIATGRGKSARESLREIVPSQHWGKMLVGYYNCAEVGPLEDDSRPDAGPCKDKHMLDALDLLRGRGLVTAGAKVTFRSKQITVEDAKTGELGPILTAEKASPKLRNVKIVESSHSIDILHKDVSKLNMVKQIQEALPDGDQVLCIGDMGRWPGNDSELLSHPHSLSVGTVPAGAGTCWNLSPPAKRGEAATRACLERFRLRGKRLIWEGPA